MFYEKQLGVAKAIAVTGKDWKKFISEWCRLEAHRMHFSRVEGNQLFYSYPQPKHNYASIALQKDIFFLKPIVIRGGFEYWTLASWDREKLDQPPKEGQENRQQGDFHPPVDSQAEAQPFRLRRRRLP